MVAEMAKKGRGSVYLIDNIGKLKPAVVRALKAATEPSLKAGNLIFGNKSIEIGEIFCGQIY